MKFTSMGRAIPEIGSVDAAKVKLRAAMLLKAVRDAEGSKPFPAARFIPPGVAVLELENQTEVPVDKELETFRKWEAYVTEHARSVKLIR